MINLTPHSITLIVAGEQITLPPSGTIARVEMIEQVVAVQFGMPVIRRQPGVVVNLPTDDSPCIVSAMVLAAVPAGTPNVYAPDTGASALRNGQGHVVAVTRLVAA